jgi:NADH-quinone oxidoreductase subunit K
MNIPSTAYLLVSAALFSIGLGAVLARKHAILILVGIELMLAAANLNFIVFWKYNPQPDPFDPTRADLTGVVFVLFSIALAAAEAAVGLALVIAAFRHYRTSLVDKMEVLKG